ncbi:MAG: acetyl-CoA carboxylase biotin carboxyl carrier protein [Cyclobacteriaceae bacterium]
MSKDRTSKSTSKKETKAGRTPVASASSAKAEMPTLEIRGLIDFIAKSGLNEVNIETKELKLYVKREPDQKIFKSASATPAIAQSSAQIAAAASLAAGASTTASPETSGKKTAEIKSPMIGTFYRSSSPDSPPFISVGDKVSKGQTVCIIEAMKLFNEIESEISGTVTKVMLENATPVEYDQVLFVVEPD